MISSLFPLQCFPLLPVRKNVGKYARRTFHLTNDFRREELASHLYGLAEGMEAVAEGQN